MSVEYPYSALCVFRNEPDKTAWFVGINARKLEDSDFYGVDLDKPFPKTPTSLWRRRMSNQSFPHLAFILKDDIIPPCAPFDPLQVIVVNKKTTRHDGNRYGLSHEHCCA